MHAGSNASYCASSATFPFVVWVGPRGLDYEAIVTEGQLAAVLCCDWSDDLAVLSSRIGVSSIEATTGVREQWGRAFQAQIDPHMIADVIMRAADTHKGPLVVIAYRAFA